MSNPAGDGSGKPVRVYGRPEDAPDETEATQASNSEGDPTTSRSRGHRRTAKATRSSRTSGSSEQTETKAKIRHVPPGPVPVTGLLGLLWKWPNRRLYARFGWTWLLKRTNRERYNIAMGELWNKRKVQKIVAFVNSKGGSAKTACTVWLSVFIAFAIRRHVIALDANENTGHTAKRLNILRSSEATEPGKVGTIELRAYLKMCEEGLLDNLDSFTDQVDWDDLTGVSVIASEAASNDRFTQASFEGGLKTAKRYAHHVFCDLGNGIQHPANLGSVNLAQTLVFTGNVNMADSLSDIANTMSQYSQLGYPEKVKNGVIVIVGAKVRQRKEFAERYDFPIGRLFVIPNNRYMKAGKRARVGRVPLRIRAILLEILVAIINAEVVESEVDLKNVSSAVTAENFSEAPAEVTNGAPEAASGSSTIYPTSINGSLQTAQLSGGGS